VNKKQKIIALDPGSKNIGLAISDADQIMAFAKQTFDNNPSGHQSILEFCLKENVTTVILGIPFKTDIHHPSQKLLSILRKLAPSLDLILFNEDYSTQDAIEHLKAAGYTPEEIKAKKDSMSAQVILTKYLS